MQNKYYIKGYPKIDFYLLGTKFFNIFIEGKGMKFVKEYIREYPYLLEELSVIDKNNKSISLYDFLELINEKTKQIK